MPWWVMDNPLLPLSVEKPGRERPAAVPDFLTTV